MIVEATKIGAPLVMVNARMSLRSFARWRRAKKFIAALLERFELILAQSFDDAERLEALGALEVQVTGNLKYDAPAPPADHRELAELSGLTSGRKIWVAASTHSGEELAAAEAHANIVKRFPDALTLIAPRHPGRGEAIEAQLRATVSGPRCARAAKGQRRTSKSISATPWANWACSTASPALCSSANR